MTLKFWQIIFDTKQLGELYPFATPYYNETLTPYFENSVIADLVPKSEADYVAVCSWALKRKRHTGGAQVRLYQMYGNADLTEEKILSSDADVMILTPTPHKDILQKFYHWHGDAAKLAVKEFNNFMRFPETVKNAIYENHFIARKEIYQEYVTTCLVPAIQFISDKEVFKAASGYRKKKERITTGGDVRATLNKLGMEDWPIGVFLLERLFSIWINNKDLKVVPL